MYTCSRKWRTGPRIICRVSSEPSRFFKMLYIVIIKSSSHLHVWERDGCFVYWNLHIRETVAISSNGTNATRWWFLISSTKASWIEFISGHNLKYHDHASKEWWSGTVVHARQNTHTHTQVCTYIAPTAQKNLKAPAFRHNNLPGHAIAWRSTWSLVFAQTSDRTSNIRPGKAPSRGLWVRPCAHIWILWTIPMWWSLNQQPATEFPSYQCTCIGTYTAGHIVRCRALSFSSRVLS